jgi:hypothetical protein
VLAAPADDGVLELIVVRPDVGSRRLLGTTTLDPACGVTGDSWRARAAAASPDRSPGPDRQLTLMNHRFALLVAGEADRVPLAGDQLYVDLDLSHDNLPAGSRLEIGSAVVELTEPPHTGCAKFVARFGREAMQFVNSPEGRHHRLRGANARVVTAGTVAVGDRVRRLPPATPPAASATPRSPGATPPSPSATPPSAPATPPAAG